MIAILRWSGLIICIISVILSIPLGYKKVRMSRVGHVLKFYPIAFVVGIALVLGSTLWFHSDSPLEVILFYIAASVFLLSLACGYFATSRPYKRRRIFSFTKIVPIGIIITGWILYFAAYYCGTSGAGDVTSGKVFRSVCTSLFHALKLFTLDGGFSSIVARTSGFGNFHLAYEIFFAVLYSVGAVATLTVFLTIIKNLSAKVKYYTKRILWLRRVHVFSCLTEESLAIAYSLVLNGDCEISSKKKKIRKPVIVFTDISRRGTDGDLIERAKEIGAVLFHKDITNIRFCGRRHVYYLMGTDEGEKLRQAKDLAAHYDNAKNSLYVFSESVQSEMFLNGLELKNIKLVRINAIQSLIYRTLYDNGARLFETASTSESGDKVISAVIVGLGMYGTEMLKALTWYCQMDGYRLKINAYDSDANAEKRLRLSCPDMMAMSDKEVDGDSYYSIKVHKFDTEDPAFYEHLATVTDVSYVFVCLGDDERNAKMAKSIRELYSGLKNAKDYFADRLPGTPDIETVIYDTSIKEKLGMSWSNEKLGAGDKEVDGGGNFRGEPYRIHVIGDLKSFYSAKTLTGGEADELISAAVNVHLRWTDTCTINSLYEASVIKYVKERSAREQKKTVCIVKPYLDTTAPVVSHISLEDVLDGKYDAIGISKDQLDEIRRGLYSRLGKKYWNAKDNNEFTDAEREALRTTYHGTYCFVLNNLTFNYDYTDLVYAAEARGMKVDNETGEVTFAKADHDEEILALDTLYEVAIGEQPEHREVEKDGEGFFASMKKWINIVITSPVRLVKWLMLSSDERREVKAPRKVAKLDRERREIAEKRIKASNEGQRKKFWRYSYYYRSSICKAMHENLRSELVERGLIGDEALKSAIQNHRAGRCSKNDLLIVCNLEHIRWNAFMRSEGYSYAGTRYDLAKQHNSLVPTGRLTAADLRKDV